MAVSEKRNFYNSNFMCIPRLVKSCRRLKASTLSAASLRDPDARDDGKYTLTSDMRGHWSLRIDFILSCIGYAVGLGNIIRFPFKVLRYGGGTFIIAYLVMLYVMAVPLFLLELVVAQFTSRGVTECWHFAPGLKGIGYIMLLMSISCSLYYNILIGWGLYYLVSSLRMLLPWSHCNNYWNDNMCVPAAFEGVRKVNSSMETSSEQFWIRHVITRVKTVNRSHYIVLNIDDNPETIVWYTALSMLAAWVICALILMYGIKVSGKAMWAFATFPYVVITIMFIVGSRLEGSLNGIRYYLRFDLRKILRPKVWQAAAEQIFYSLGVGFGGMMTFGSYNNFHDNLQRDVLIISTINSATSIYGGFAVFQLLGFMAYRYGDDMEGMTKYAGDGLVFIAYPEVLSNFRGANVLCVLFFTMIFCLGMDSQVGMMETVITGVLDEFPWLHGSRSRRTVFVWCIHVICGLSALLMVTKTGFFWYTLMNNYCAATNILMVGFFECVAVVFVYGINNLNRDFKMMLGFSMSWYWRICLLVPIPIIILALTMNAIYTSGPTVVGYGYNKVVFPFWADFVGWILFLLTLVPLPVFFIYTVTRNFTKEKLTLLQSLLFSVKPDMLWGPGTEDKWMTETYYANKLERFINNPDFTFYKINLA